MVLVAYNIILTLLSPLLRIYFAFKGIKDIRYIGTLEERYGHYSPQLKKPDVAFRIWIHAVSVGEVVGATPLIKNVMENIPGVDLIVSTTTKTGREMLLKTFSNVKTFYFPFDFPLVAKRAVNFLRPDILVLMETELWPNVISRSRRRGAHILLLNGRVSERMAEAKGFIRSMYKCVFSKIEYIGMQSEADAQRLLSLGAPRDRVEVVGNMKFDGIMAALDDDKIQKLSALVNPSNRPMFAAGSTHPGEEEFMLDAFAAARSQTPGLLLVIAPRHIERAPDVEALVKQRSFTSVRRSALEDVLRDNNASDKDVVILDTIGELRYLYALATACFVGGSLIERGGHNVLEPAACGKAPFYGPYTANFTDSVRVLENGGGGRPVSDAHDLAIKLSSVLLDDQARTSADKNALKVVLDNAGASRRAFDILKKHI